MNCAPEPRVLIVGAQKGGTTSLAAALSADSRFWLPGGETPLFEDPIYELRGEASLKKIRAAAEPGKIAAIKRPDWLGRPEAPPRIAVDCADSIIVCALRDRVRRTVSAYYWYLQTRLVPLLPLNEGLSLILNSMESGNEPTSPRAAEIVNYSLYGAGIERFLAAGFERERLLIGHALPDGPAQFDLLTQLQKVLGLQEPIVHSEGRRRNPGVYDYRRIRLLRARSRMLDHGRHSSVQVESKLLPVYSAVSKSFTAIERSLFSRLGDSGPEDLRPEVNGRLKSYFREDDARFEAATGHRLDTMLGID